MTSLLESPPFAKGDEMRKLNVHAADVLESKEGGVIYARGEPVSPLNRWLDGKPNPQRPSLKLHLYLGATLGHPLA